MTEQTLTIHVPLEPRVSQRQDLDDLTELVRQCWNAMVTVTRSRAIDEPMTVSRALCGEAPLWPPVSGRIQMPRVRPTSFLRGLMEARSERGWTSRLSRTMLDGLARQFCAACGKHAPGAWVPVSALPTTRAAGQPIILPARGAATLRDSTTLEVLGLSDGNVPVHLPLPRVFQDAIQADIDQTADSLRTRQEDLHARVLTGCADSAEVLAFQLGRYPIPGPACPASPHHLSVVYQGVEALVQRRGLDGQYRYHARLRFHISGVPAPVAPDSLVGVDRGIRHLLTYWSTWGTPGVLSNDWSQHWAFPTVGQRGGRVRSPYDIERARVRWYGRLHATLQPALDEAVLGRLGLLNYAHIALEQLAGQPLAGPAGFGTFHLHAGLDSAVEILTQLRSPVWVDPAYTSTTCARSGRPGVRRGLLFRSPASARWSLADLNAAQVIYQRGAAALASVSS